MKSLLLAAILSISAHSVMAEIKPDDPRPIINDEFIVEEIRYAILNTPKLEYSSAELWLQNILIFDLFVFPEVIASELDKEKPVQNSFETDFTSNYTSTNFPCGHFGNWAEFNVFPASSSDSNIQECGGGLPYNLLTLAGPIKIDIPPIPEPETHGMLLLGMVLLGYAVRKRPGEAGKLSGIRNDLGNASDELTRE